MKDIIILGGGPSWKECPFDTEVWAVTSVLLIPEINCYEKIKKVFSFDDYSEVKPEVDRAKTYSIPVVSTFPYADENYPTEEIRKEFGACLLRNSISYMLAYALYKGYEKLRLYGVDMGPEWKYLSNKPCVYYWLGVATGRGVKFEIAKSSTLELPMADEIRKYVSELQKRATDLRTGLASGRYRI